MANNNSQTGKTLVLRDRLNALNKDKRAQFFQVMPPQYRDMMKKIEDGKSQVQIGVDWKMTASNVGVKVKGAVKAIDAWRKGYEIKTTPAGRLSIGKELREEIKEEVKLVDEIPEEELDKLTAPENLALPTEEEGEVDLKTFMESRGIDPAKYKGLAKTMDDVNRTAQELDKTQEDIMVDAVIARIAERAGGAITRTIIKWLS